MAKMKLPIQYKKQLPAGLGCMALLLFGSASLIKAGSVDYYTVIGTLIKAVPASLIIAGLGWVMGSILDRKTRRGRLSSFGLGNIVLDDMVPDDLNKPDDDIDSIESLTPKAEVD